MGNMIAVIDTNVIVAGLRSSMGASHRILEAIASDQADIALSVPLFLEYEDVLKRPEIRRDNGLSLADVDVILDVLAAKSRHTTFHFLWRPQLRDPKDEMVLETAANAGADCIVTFNRKDFLPAATAFNIDILFPKDYLPHLTLRSKS